MKKIAFTGIALAFPFFAFAQTVNSIQDLTAYIINLINTQAVPLIFAIGFVVLLWGIFEYFIAGSRDDKKRKEGRLIILYGVIGFAVMLSVWGLVHILTGSVSTNNSQPDYPTIRGTSR